MRSFFITCAVILALILAITVFQFTLPEKYLSTSYLVFLQTPAWLFAFGVWRILICFEPEKKSTTAWLGMHRVKLIWLFYASILMLFLLVCSTLLDKYVLHLDIQKWERNLFAESSHHVLLALVMVVLMPFFEECFFRGYLLTAWQSINLSPFIACCGSSLLWVAIHLQYPLMIKLLIFIMGLFLAGLRYWSRSLWAPLWGHMLFNALQVMFVVVAY